MPGFPDDPVLARLRRRLGTRSSGARPPPRRNPVDRGIRWGSRRGGRRAYGAGRAAGHRLRPSRPDHPQMAALSRDLRPVAGADDVGSAARMLEIGVSKGGSLGLWRKFLGDRAVVYGVDIDPSCARFDGETASVRIGSQDDPAFLRRVVAEMGGVDIVLDDGSHVASHQRASFEVRCFASLPKAVFISSRTCTPPIGRLRRRPQAAGHAVEFLKDKVDDMHRHYRIAGLNQADSMPDIESVTFFDSIAVVRKRKQRPRFHVQVPPSDRRE